MSRSGGESRQRAEPSLTAEPKGRRRRTRWHCSTLRRRDASGRLRPAAVLVSGRSARLPARSSALARNRRSVDRLSEGCCWCWAACCCESAASVVSPPCRRDAFRGVRQPPRRHPGPKLAPTDGQHSQVCPVGDVARSTCRPWHADAAGGAGATVAVFTTVVSSTASTTTQGPMALGCGSGAIAGSAPSGLDAAGAEQALCGTC